MFFNTYAAIKLYDEPVRKYLTNKYIIKKKINIENIVNEKERNEEQLNIGVLTNEDEDKNLLKEKLNKDNIE